LEIPARGVAELAVESSEENGLQCFFSQALNNEQILRSPTKGAALAFHGVVQAIFHQTAVIPFRFPTILETKTDLLMHMHDQKDTFQEALLRLRDVVQMDIQLTHAAARGVAEIEARIPSETTGGQYLRHRQMQRRELADSAAPFRDLGDHLVRDWRERPSARGLRCFLLIDRNNVDDFKTRVASARIAADVVARVSGPWPASEFVKKS
jgi:hypothetical protein